MSVHPSFLSPATDQHVGDISGSFFPVAVHLPYFPLLIHFSALTLCNYSSWEFWRENFDLGACCLDTEGKHVCRVSQYRPGSRAWGGRHGRRQAGPLGPHRSFALGCSATVLSGEHGTWRQTAPCVPVAGNPDLWMVFACSLW